MLPRAKRARSDFQHQLSAVANGLGQVSIWVWTLGGVTKRGRDLDQDPYRVAYPSAQLADVAAKKLGPKVYVVQALYLLDGKIRWAK